MTMPEFSRLAYLGDLTSDQLDEEARRLVGEVDDLRDTISLLSQRLSSGRTTSLPTMPRTRSARVWPTRPTESAREGGRRGEHGA